MNMLNSGNWESAQLGYSTVESLLDDVSKQMSLSNLSRFSRGSNGQRIGSTTGGSIRVAKPNSASSSPRGSIGLGRRRTVMADGPFRRRMVMEASTPGGYVSNDGLQVPSRSNRPVSWHPSSYQTPQTHYQPTYPAPAFDFDKQSHFINNPQNSAVYSGYTSPSSTFSHFSMPYNGYEQQQQLQQQQQHQQQYNLEDVSAPSQMTSSYAFSQPTAMEQHPPNYVTVPSQNTDQTMYSHFDWNNFSTSGFEGSTAPPTPDDFLPIQHPEPNFPAEELIPYHPLSDTESTGEDLIGLGLYDNPESTKSPTPDSHLDIYRSAMMSQLLGAAYRRPEPVGKGLKLEETWQPPESDDEKDEDEDDDSEQDGEGEDDDEAVQEEVKSNTVTYPVQGVQQLDHSGWL